MRTILTMSEEQMPDWTEICNAFAKKMDAELLFVNNTSCGLQYPDGSLHHIYVDEMMEILEYQKSTSA